MVKTTTIASLALGMLTSGAAMAQQMELPKSPAATMPPAANQSAPTKSVAVVEKQQPNEMLASEMRGLSVKNSLNESLGTISDIVTTDDGKVNAVLISIGGFLGIGASDVALPHNNIRVTTDKSGYRIALIDATRESLEKAPRYVTVKAQHDAEQARQQQVPRAPSAPGGAPKTNN